MTKEFDVYFDKTTSYDIELGSKEHVYNIFLGRDSKRIDIFIDSLPMHTVVEPGEDIYLIINSSGVEVDVYGSLTLDPNYICLDSSASTTAHKYVTNLANDVCLGIDIDSSSTWYIVPEETGIEMDMEAAFVVRRLRYLYDLDGSTLRSFETQTLEELTYIIVPI